MPLLAILAFGLLAPALGAQARGDTIDLRDRTLSSWGLQEELRIGSADGPHDAFVSIAGLQTDPAGRLLILDVGTPALKLFDANGEFVRQIGRRGEGPGEYLAPGAFGLQADTVWIADARLGRMTRFLLDGTRLETTSFGDGTGAPGLMPVDGLEEEGFLAVTPVRPPAPGPDLPAGPIRFDQHTVRTDRAGEVRDTVASSIAEFPAIRLGERRTMTVPFVIRQEPIVAFDPGSDLVREVHRPAPPAGGEAWFRIVIRDRRGAVLRGATFVDHAVALGGSVRERLVRQLDVHLGQPPPELLEEAVDHLRIPDAQPPVTALAKSNHGELWLQREPFPEGGIRFLVLDEGLRPMATVELPESARNRVGPVSAEHLWAVERDDLDVPYLVRYRIVK